MRGWIAACAGMTADDAVSVTIFKMHSRLPMRAQVHENDNETMSAPDFKSKDAPS
jgi:hypothetical protein